MNPKWPVALILTKRTQTALGGRYRRLRIERKASRALAIFLTLAYLPAFCLLELDSSFWRAVLHSPYTGFDRFRQRPLKPADPLRYAIQGLWLMCAISPWSRAEPPGAKSTAFWKSLTSQAKSLHTRFVSALESVPARWHRSTSVRMATARVKHTGPRKRAFLRLGTAIAFSALAALCITQPFSWAGQLIFIALLWSVALIVRRMPGRYPTLILIALSVIVSGRYIWWRYTATLNWDSDLDLFFGITLLAAETHAWVVLILGYIQTLGPMERRPEPLPADSASWPTVDVLIPTYNEDISVVRCTVLAAMSLDWPRDKLRVYILDDGKRDQFRVFAQEAGVGYITRPDSRHAKAGNLNHAMSLTHGELLAIFDCDHIPSRSFLQIATGWFLRQKKLAVMQTPHHFLSPDPFERNLHSFRRQPNENALFYGLIQDGNDTWDASFFCGSCAVLRRSAIEAIGGFAVETVTEDAHTALRLHRAGYSSAYLRIPQAAGLATESLSAHVGQRMRWARGMAQIFRTDNPLLGKGLSLCQRLCYLNATLHFLGGVPRLVFLLAPLAFLLLHAYIIYAPALVIVLYVLPHMMHASLTSSHMQGQYRHSFWSEVYETALAWYVAWPTTVALVCPGKGTFNVTAKGGLVDRPYFDWAISRPYLCLAGLNAIGIGFGFWRLETGPRDELMTVVITMLWVVYNLIIIGAAIAVASETRQVRQSPRIGTRQRAAVYLPDGHGYPAVLDDFSSTGVGLHCAGLGGQVVGADITVLLQRGTREFTFEGTVLRHRDACIGVRLKPMDTAHYRNFIGCTYGRADAWLGWSSELKPDQPLHSLASVAAASMHGYAELLRHAPPIVQAPTKALVALARWLSSFLPRNAARPLSHVCRPALP